MKGYQTPRKNSCFYTWHCRQHQHFLLIIVYSPSQVEQICLLNNCPSTPCTFIVLTPVTGLGVNPALLVFTALHVMQTRYCEEISVRLSVRPSVCLSVCHTHVL